MLARHDATGLGREGGGGGSPESEDLPLVATVPLEEGGNVRYRSLVLLGAFVAGLILATPSLAVRVQVRVEGAKTTIFGPTEPRLTAVTGTITPPAGPAVTVATATPLGALEAASRRGEFFYRLESFGFGPYVAQIGRLSGTATTGWVYKVNGVSPPVAASAYELKEGDRVLWYHATFGPAGGPRTLRLIGRYVTGCASGGGCRTQLVCARAVQEDDNGRRAFARDVVFLVDGRRVRSRRGEICPRGHWHRVAARKAGAVRSNELVNPGGGTGAAAPAGALAGRAS